MDIANHPCFNAEVRHTTGRIHLAVAPRCNVQCNFCNRSFDCANESRPGVTAAVLKPAGAVEYLGNVLQKVRNLAVVGIAGPGDPFANPDETLETLERVHIAFPDLLLCVSSNGLSLAEYVSALADLKVSHVTVTVNAVDPHVGANVYEWVYYNKQTYHGEEGAAVLLEKQTQAVQLLKRHGIIVKVNTVVIPRVNEHHVPEISAYVAALGADIQNCIPMIPVAGTPFETLSEPSSQAMRLVRAQTSLHLPQMSHCARCRADAVGLLGEAEEGKLQEDTHQQQVPCDFLQKPYIAVASSDGVTIDRHLGEVDLLWIFDKDNGSVRFVEQRLIPKPDARHNRWDRVTQAVTDCGALLVGGLGQTPYEQLQRNGVRVESVAGNIAEIARALFDTGEIPRHALRMNGACGVGNRCGNSDNRDFVSNEGCTNQMAC